MPEIYGVGNNNNMNDYLDNYVRKLNTHKKTKYNYIQMMIQ